jgi:FixJ family two-component response regulator
VAKVAQTLGEQLDAVQDAITKTLTAQSYQKGDNQISRAALSKLEAREEKLLAKIQAYGRNYIEGQNSEPIGDTSLVSFV